MTEPTYTLRAGDPAHLQLMRALAAVEQNRDGGGDALASLTEMLKWRAERGAPLHKLIPAEVDDAIPLTKRQAQVIRVIQDAVDRTGIVPSYREVSIAMGFSSHGWMSDMITRLEARGWVARSEGRMRSLRLLRRLPDRVPARQDAA